MNTSNPSDIPAPGSADAASVRQAPRIAFIIPAHNEAELLPGTLASLNRAIAEAAIGDRSEIIVVDDASTDRTAELAAAAGARVLSVEHRHIAATRNAGATASAADILFFLDADTAVTAATLRAALRSLGQGAIAGGAPVRLDETPTPGAAFGLRLWNCLSRTFRWAAGCFIFTRREVFEAVGGFNTRFYAAEEIALSHALKKQGPFTVLATPVTTSARKLRDYPVSAHFMLAIKTLLTFGRTIRRREDLGLWYETGRGQQDSHAATK